MTTPHSDDPWEKRLHEELRRLPDLEAPASLASDVLAAIRAREARRVAAWWRRPATTWRPALRASFSAAVLALFVATMLALPSPAPTVRGGGLAATIVGFWSALATLGDAFALVLREALSPTVLAVAIGVSVSNLALLGLGGALWHAAVQPRR